MKRTRDDEEEGEEDEESADEQERMPWDVVEVMLTARHTGDETLLRHKESLLSDERKEDATMPKWALDVDGLISVGPFMILREKHMAEDTPEP